ncbi:hypothetical protein D3C78_354880 [compost metagenome]
MSRKGMRLTEQAQDERDDFEAGYGSPRNCSCFQSAPCGCCTHPGNPHNQDEDDEAWEPDEEDDA